jgi:PH (Pleckstrin Homology) domain-containing protein
LFATRLSDRILRGNKGAGVVGYVEQTLAAGERVIVRARLHWIIFAAGAVLMLLAVVVLGIGLAVRMVAPPGAPDANGGINVGFAILAVALLVTVRRLADFLTTEIAATTRRFIVKRGLIRRTVMEINAGQLESVMVHQTVLGRLLDYGTIVAGGTGSGLDPVHKVAAPLALRDALNRISARPPPLPDSGPRPTPASRGVAAVIIGDGKYGFPVVGESHHEAALEQLAGGRTEHGVHVSCAALLMPQPDNPYDPDAVAVFIRAQEVGYLARNVTGEFLRALTVGGYDRAACEAVIIGSWDRGAGDRGNFGVRLNACRPFRLEAAENWARRPPGRHRTSSESQ